MPIPLVVVEVDAASTPAIHISDEVFAPTTAASCSGQSASSTTGIALRTAIEAQDDVWRAAAVLDGASSFVLLNFPTPSNANEVDVQPTLLSAAGANLVVGVSKRDVSPAVRDSLAADSFGAADATSYRDPYTPTWGTSASASTLQECAPRPQFLYDGVALPQPRMWNTLGGDGGTLDASYFEFSRPVDSFGAWFGDLETRTDGEGVPAVLKLFDADGNVLYLGPIPTSTSSQSATCGGSGTLGCGNKATRWIGFHGLDSQVASMLVVVGDDDSCVSVSSCEGFTEHLSWIGATVGLGPAELTIDKVAPPGPHSVGALVAYTIMVGNIGDAAASSVTVNDEIPEGLNIVSASGGGWTCSVSGQNVGCAHNTGIGAAESAEAITIMVEVTAESELTILNQAQVEYAASSGSRTATGDVSISREPVVDLVVGKSGVIRPDDSMVWAIAVTNNGPDSAANVVATDTLPAGLLVDSISASGWTCVEASLTIECQLDEPLSADGAASFSILTSSSIGSAVFDNEVLVESSTTDLNIDDNKGQGSVDLVIAPPPTTTTSTSPTTTVSPATSAVADSGGTSSGPGSAVRSNVEQDNAVNGRNELAMTGRSLALLGAALLVVAAGILLVGVSFISRRHPN